MPRRPTKRKSLNPEERRRKRVSIAVANPVYFGEIYMKPYTEGWKGKSLPPIAGAMLLFAQSVRRGVICTPPEWMKTTVLSQLRPLWLTYRWAALGRVGLLAGMLLSEEQQLAERNLGVTAWHVLYNDRLHRDFVDEFGRPLVEPDPDEEKWTDSSIVIRRPGVAKDPTWQAKGIKAMGIQSARLTHLLGDDVVTPRSAGSPALQSEAKRLWDEQITTRVLEHGQALIAGNYNGARDLLAHLASRQSYAVFKRPSLHVKGDPTVAPDDPRDPEAVVALPEKWSLERLMDELAEKPNAFRRIHLLDAKAEAGEKLKVHWMQVIPPEDTPVASVKWIFALDPAVGSADDQAKGGDDLSFFNITIGALHGEHFDIALSHDFRDSTGEAAATLATYFDRFNRYGLGVHAIGISKVALDTSFKGALKILRPDVARKLVPIPGITKHSKFDRLEALGPYAMSGWLRCWDTCWVALTSAPNDRAQELSLFEQWRDFPKIGHDDKLDGLDVAIRTTDEFGGAGKRRKAKLKVAAG